MFVVQLAGSDEAFEDQYQSLRTGYKKTFLSWD